MFSKLENYLVLR